MSSSAQSAVSELEDELNAFRAQWQQEARLRRERQQQQHPPPSASTSRHPLPTQPGSPEQPRSSIEEDDQLRADLEELRLEDKGQDREVVHAEAAANEVKERERPRSALELYSYAVASEREGRMQDALVNYRSAFRLDPDVDRAYQRATVAAQQHASSRGAEPHAPAAAQGEFRFERTVQLGPDYDAKKEHRSKEEAERESGSGDKDSTHPSSTAFLLKSLLKSVAENPFERPPPAVSAAPATSPSASPSQPVVPLPPAPTDKPSSPALTPEEALASLSFIPADEEKPLPLSRLPHEVLILILQHLVLSSVLPPPRPAHVEPEQSAPVGGKGKRALKKRTLKEEMLLLETELELEDTDREWKSDVEALERFGRVCRFARVLTLDAALWRALCHRTYVPPQQIPREENAKQLVRQHGNDWRRFFIEHPRIRLDGCYISVVTYLRRGASESTYAPTHLITFYRYLRFYHHGLVISLLTTDPPNSVVRRLNPSLRMKGLSFGRWRLRGDLCEVWGLEDPGVPEASRKYSFRMNLRFKSSARGRMNKLEMLSLATENRITLELEDVPIRPTKPFYHSKVAAYAGEDRPEQAA
ncbi:hypothetical protein JCM10213_006112 [Rhodosporidiobolus nylandii]